MMDVNLAKDGQFGTLVVPSRHHLNKMEQLEKKLPTLKEHLDLIGKIGEGTFSSVYLAKGKKSPKERYAVKHLTPTCHPKKIYKELKCMHQLGGHDNIVEVLMCLRSKDCVVFIMPYLPHDKFNNFIKDLTPFETQIYMKELLLAVRRVHLHGIIHRDIKPSNFLFNREKRRCLLVDFGLAQSVSEDIKNENVENMSEDQINKKRKREKEETEEQPLVKRQALQPLSSNISNSGWEDLSKSSSGSIILKKTMSNQQRKFNNLTPADGKVSFVRVQNSQMKALGGVFAAPLVVPKANLLNSSGSASKCNSPKCHCDGRPRVCNLCITRRGQNAPRAGTPGFRPPEVLLRYPHQTTAVDMWACGVILMCILSATYPFFHSPDDITALAEIITLFGTKEVKNLARKLGRNIVCSEETVAVDLRRVCLRLRSKNKMSKSSIRKCDLCKVPILENIGCICQGLDVPYPVDRFPPESYDLLRRLLDIDHTTRITANEALSHPFFSLNLESTHTRKQIRSSI